MAVDPNLTVHERCLQDLALLFQGLNLQGVLQSGNIGGNVFAKMFADDLTDVVLPGILVTCESGEEILDVGETFENRAWGYPCAVLVIDNAATIDPSFRPDGLRWRHDAMALMDTLAAGQRSVPFQIFPNTPEVWNLSLRPRSIFEEWQRLNKEGVLSNMMIASSFVVICHVNESRARG